MEENTLLEISTRIKEIRRDRNITVQELADRVSVSKGLISQIENNRTVPSLLVLVNIIRALEVDLNQFFKDIAKNSSLAPVIIKRKNEYESFEKEQAVGFLYQRIFTKAFKNSTVDIVLLELEPDATRPMVVTEAFEYKYILAGKVDYIFEDQQYSLSEGDSMLFDGRLPHTPKNVTDQKAIMLIIYFFEQNGNTPVAN
ncbi:transcriptional regulator, XRE family with cupin sensor [Mucilaginibacter mallensis]|uniref:Transcriptional regulator, XRE family with cupin sensor n=1 Tax=Mucilaginibacter mallensis TaxID=652787 RepID=A0A1H1YSW7_MUCMA|nr:XRE family transcriptional regulator [Mucilaginibacter mallensis]SDT24508.1 transcriptional regulator, XRE family with cupin sensor [Mucilaginibacter mallensis]